MSKIGRRSIKKKPLLPEILSLSLQDPIPEFHPKYKIKQRQSALVSPKQFSNVTTHRLNIESAARRQRQNSDMMRMVNLTELRNQAHTNSNDLLPFSRDLAQHPDFGYTMSYE